MNVENQKEDDFKPLLNHIYKDLFTNGKIPKEIPDSVFLKGMKNYLKDCVHLE